MTEQLFSFPFAMSLFVKDASDLKKTASICKNHLLKINVEKKTVCMERNSDAACS